MERRSFKTFVLEEGGLLDAVKHGFKVGIKAFSEKRKVQAKQKECRIVADKILSAEGKELERLMRQVVDDGFSIQHELRPQKITDWLKECTTTKPASACGKSPPTT